MRVALVVLLALLLLPLAGCGGGTSGSGQELYGTYRSTEDTRDEAESRLRLAFSDIAQAAREEDRNGVRAAAGRGQSAAADIRRLLAREIAAAAGLAELEELTEDATRLKGGLERTRDGLALFERELVIALDDPLLADRANATLVSRLSRRAVRLTVEGEIAIRKADHALALALELTPRSDELFPTTSGR